LLPQTGPHCGAACYGSKHNRKNEIHGVLLGSPKAARPMPDRTYTAIAGDDCVQPAQRIELAGARGAESRNAPGRGAIEHHDNRAAMIVVLATELEQAIARCRAAAFAPARAGRRSVQAQSIGAVSSRMRVTHRCSACSAPESDAVVHVTSPIMHDG
jgi:hypothetical protein